MTNKCFYCDDDLGDDPSEKYCCDCWEVYVYPKKFIKMINIADEACRLLGYMPNKLDNGVFAFDMKKSWL